MSQIMPMYVITVSKNRTYFSMKGLITPVDFEKKRKKNMYNKH